MAGVLSGAKDAPPPPEELQWLWMHYQRLSRRRQAGMGPNPISFLEIEAYERKALVRFSAWETELLTDLDDVVVRHALQKIERNNTTSKPGQVPANNPKAVKAMFRGLAASRNSR